MIGSLENLCGLQTTLTFLMKISVQVASGMAFCDLGQNLLHLTIAPSADGGQLLASQASRHLGLACDLPILD